MNDRRSGFWFATVIVAAACVAGSMCRDVQGQTFSADHQAGTVGTTIVVTSSTDVGTEPVLLLRAPGAKKPTAFFKLLQAGGNQVTGKLAPSKSLKPDVTYSLILRIGGVEHLVGEFTIERPRLVTAGPQGASAGETVLLHGEYFGTTQGTVKIGGKKAIVTSWQMDTIECRISPKLTKLGASAVTVKTKFGTTKAGLAIGALGPEGIPSPTDVDLDGVPNSSDPDIDGDGLPNGDDPFPSLFTERYDDDSDGVGNGADADEDHDEVPDWSDDFPLDPSLTKRVVMTESEFNDNVQLADPVDPSLATATIPPPQLSMAARLPRVDAELQKAHDVDMFVIAPPPNQPVSLVVRPTVGSRFALGGVSIGVWKKSGGLTPWLPIDLPPPVVGINAVFENAVYVVVVTDVNGIGAPGAAYELSLCIDHDRDGVSDDGERALGMDSTTVDSEGDGVRDYGEQLVHTADVDADALPAWFDKDSDGDGCPDAIEGTCDADDDGRGNLVDVDSDGAGASDAKSFAAKWSTTKDHDGDGVADALDVDDDADGLRDFDDPAPNQPLSEGPPTKAIRLIRAGTQVSSTVVAHSTLVRGKTIVVEGDGFVADDLDRYRVRVRSVYGGLGTSWPDGTNQLLIAPTSVTASAMTAVLPLEAASGSVSVVDSKANRVSTSLDVAVVPMNAPLVTATSKTNAKFNDTVVITGTNFSVGGSAPIVMVGDVPLSVTSYSNTSINTKVPATAVAGDVRVVTSIAASNARYLSIQRSLPGSLTLPAGAPGPVTAYQIDSGALVSPVTPASSGQFNLEILNRHVTVVTATRNVTDDEPPVLLGVVAPSDTSIVVDSGSSIVTMAWLSLLAIGASPRSDTEQDALIGAIRSHTQLPAASAQFAQLTASDPQVVAHLPKPLAKSIATIAIDALKSIQAQSVSASASTPEVTITPAEQAGFAVSADTESPGNLVVSNDTLVYASAGMVSTKPMGQVVLAHVQGLFDAGLIDPQEGLLGLFGAAETKIDAPHGKDVTLELITGGSAKSSFGSPSDPNAHYDVVANTFVLGVGAPILDALFSKVAEAKFGKKFWVEVVTGLDKSVMHAIVSKLLAGQHKLAVTLFLDLVLNDLKQGSESIIISKIEEKYGKSIAQAVVKKLGKRFLGVVGLISTIWDIIVLTAEGTDVAATITDMSSVPARLNFKVDFDIHVSNVTPNRVVGYHYGGADQDVTLEIEGTGFLPSTGEVAVRIGNVVVDDASVDPGGSRVVVRLKEHDVNALPTGMVDVAVILDPHTKHEIESDAASIEVLDHPWIDLITPKGGAPGTTIRIEGIGFAPDVDANLAIFTTDGGQVEPGETTGADGTGTSVFSVVPDGALTGPLYVRIVKPDGSFANSNSVDFNGSGEFTVTYVDNGSAKDDIFALYFDGQFVDTTSGPTWPAKVVPIMADAGEHVVELYGIAAPDNIGTYSISFSGNVTVNIANSDPLTGTDLVSGAVKRFEIELADPAALTLSGWLAGQEQARPTAPQIEWVER